MKRVVVVESIRVVITAVENLEVTSPCPVQTYDVGGDDRAGRLALKLRNAS